MNSFWLLFCISPLVLNAFAQEYHYQLPDGDVVKTLNVTINRAMYKPVIHVYCLNYDALKDFEIRRGHLWTLFQPSLLIELTFVGCFNNETDNENFRSYRLWDTISRAENFNDRDVWFRLDLFLEPMAIMNGEVFLQNFNFSKFQDVNFVNFGYETSSHLKNYECRYCSLFNIRHLDFDDLKSQPNMQHLTVGYAEVININSENMRKFGTITGFDLQQFSLADPNALNVPYLFTNNNKLYRLSIVHSKHKIVLHEDVFKGLNELRHLKLINIQLDVLPNNLFNDLHKLYELDLSSNNIKKFGPTTLTHFSPYSITLKGNPIFTMPQEDIEEVTVNAIRLFMDDFTPPTLNIVEGLVNSPQLRFVTFRKLLVDPIDITEFTKVHANHDRPVEIEFAEPMVALDLEYIKLHSTIQNRTMMKLSNKKEDEANVIVKLKIRQSPFCGDCWIMKKFLGGYFDNRNYEPDFYFEQGRALIKPQVSCSKQEFHFERTFTTNCPTQCVCRYNGLLDKIFIDCSNRNLAKVPVIPYPDQYPNISTIELNFNGNFVTDLTFDNQNPRVLEKLSTIRFRNNRLVAIDLPDTVVNVLHVLDVCDNRGLQGKEIRSATGAFQYAVGRCSIGSQHPRHPMLYIKKHKTEAEIDEYLESFCSKV